MALQLLNLLCPAFLYEMCTALEWCITPTQSADLLYQPIQIHPVYSCIFYPPMGFGSCWSCLSRPSSESSMAPRSKRRLVCCITGQRPQRRQVINFILNIPGIPAYCSSDQTLYISSFHFIPIDWHPVCEKLTCSERCPARPRPYPSSWCLTLLGHGFPWALTKSCWWLGLPAGNGGSAATRGRKHWQRTHIAPWGERNNAELVISYKYLVSKEAKTMKGARKRPLLHVADLRLMLCITASSLKRMKGPFTFSMIIYCN